MDYSIAAKAPHQAHFSLDHFNSLIDQIVRWFADNAVEILIALLVAAAIVAVLMSLRSFGIRLCRNDRLGTGWPAIFGQVIARTRLWFIVMLAAEVVMSYTAPPPALAHTIQTLFTIAAALQAALWARELVLGVIDYRAGVDADHQTLGSAMSLIRVLVSVAFFAIALILILDNLGVNVTGLVAGLGIGGIAIGLAAQGIFSDLFAALSIIFDKPFRMGETVSWDQNTGVVEKIGIKSTRFRSVTGEQIIVSNSKLLEKELRNRTNLNHIRFTLNFGIVYQTPPELCAQIPDMLAKLTASLNKCQFVRCNMLGFGASGLDYELLFDAMVNTPVDAADVRTAVCLAILERFRDAGIQFAYPTQVTFTAAPDGTLVMPWPTPAGERSAKS